MKQLRLFRLAAFYGQGQRIGQGVLASKIFEKTLLPALCRLLPVQNHCGGGHNDISFELPMLEKAADR
jgi:hypothetical protein